MGDCCPSAPPATMKLFLAVCAVLAATAAADSCSNCQAVVGTLAAYLTSPDSIGKQQGILLGGLCPGVEDVEACVADLPAFWESIAMLLWPGYYDASPECEWMCKALCDAPEDSAMTCDACLDGVRSTIDQLIDTPTIEGIITALQGESFCAAPGQDDESCPESVDYVIRNGLPMLALGINPADLPTVWWPPAAAFTSTPAYLCAANPSPSLTNSPPQVVQHGR